ncbi:MAG: alpha/beta fold hydrolase [Acidobacteria bacterium]|nr:alpha/beta fold hydrolase [Acidobacteriota bacterium]
MPLLTIGGHQHYYRLDGRDDRPVVMLSHSLGQDHSMWDPQAADLGAHFSVLRYDIRGHGASVATPGEYSVEQLGRDALAIADGLGIGRFAFCGLSLGGMIGQWLALNAPDRLTALVLANTSPRPDAQVMEARRNAVLESGMGPVVATVMERFFSPRLLAANTPVVAQSRRTLAATDPTGYAGCCAAVRDTDLTDQLDRIKAHTLVISGDLDVSLPWSGHSEVLAAHIRQPRVIHLNTGHLSNLERPRAFSAALHAFLPTERTDGRESGMRVRRSVLGDAHVDQALASTASTAEFQDFITRYAWGTVWTRPGLDVRTRRMLVLAMTAAMGRWEEFRLHVRTGLAHELEWCDIEEVLLQAAIYAGVPAANTGLHAASEERDRIR